MKYSNYLRYLKGCFLIAASVISTSGKSWILCNDPSIEADFRNFQEAHDTASPMDTIFVIGTEHEPNYGEATIDKPLILVGPGYFVVDNNDPKLDFPKSTFRSITINSTAKGTEIYGLHIHWGKSGWKGIYINASDVTIARNVFSDKRSEIVFAQKGIQNISIVQNWARNIKSTVGDIANVTITNNFVMKKISGITSGTIVNNVIMYSINASDSIICNNIIFKSNNYPLGGSHYGTNNTISHNLISGPFHYGKYPPPTGIGNKENVDMSEVFKNFKQLKAKNIWGVAVYEADFISLCDNPEHSMNWAINPEGPAKHTEEKGTDAGMFGGDWPEKITGKFVHPSNMIQSSQQNQ